ncbi:MAG: hypothetical protein IPG53_19245 [Ignavibacteriales bacterium]|nr:hypothetical protein [Ignavibacteriales bacterium]
MIEQSIESVVSSVNSDNVIHDLFRYYVRPDGDEKKSSPEQQINETIQDIKKLSTDNGDKYDQ